MPAPFLFVIYRRYDHRWEMQKDRVIVIGNFKLTCINWFALTLMAQNF